MTSAAIRELLNNPQDPGLQYIANPEDYEREILQGWKMEVIPYGFPPLDHACPAKLGELTCLIGHTNVGKTTVALWQLAMLAKSGKQSVIYSAENRISGMVKNLYRFLYGHSNFTKELLFEMRKLFRFIEHKRQYSYKHMLDQAIYLLDIGFNFDFLFIDPYNALKIDKKMGVNMHDYHYEAIEDMRLFTMNTTKSIFLNCHTVTEAQRAKADANGHKPVPLDADVEGGAKFPNKADNTIVIHRQVGSRLPDEKFITEIHIRKIRNTEFGGEPTPFDSPIRIKYRVDRTGFDYLGSFEQKMNDYKTINFHEPKQNPF